MTETPSAASAPLDPAAAAEDATRKRARTTEVLEEVLRRMELAGKVEVKDSADGGISVAVFLDGEVPQGQGRRSNFVDAIQFLANKIVNRPGTSKRWISIGMGAHPEPRPPREARPPGERPAQAPAKPPPPAAGPAAPAPAVAAPAPASEARPRPNGRPLQQAPAPAQANRGSGPRPAQGAAAPPPQAPEVAMEVAEDPAISTLARNLASRSAELGRYYAISPMKAEDRARLYKAAQGASGVKVALEGEGRSRRVVFVPDKPTPMPRRALPVHDDEA